VFFVSFVVLPKSPKSFWLDGASTAGGTLSMFTSRTLRICCWLLLLLLELSSDALTVKAAEPNPANARKPTGDGELRDWLQNMVWYHRFSAEEIRSATGLTEGELGEALKRFNITAETRPTRKPGSPLLVLPYPGGRHPRIGFLEGAINPQRETKVSVFTPWDESSYVVVDVPEAIWSNLGLTYLAHTHIPTFWTKHGIELETQEWSRRPDGSLVLERALPNGISFGTRVRPGRDAVRMEMWLKNGTRETLRDLRVQNCVMLKRAAGFSAQTNANKVISKPYVTCRSDDGKRWIITAWEPCDRPWANAPVPCLHSDPKFPDCAPGETKRLRGWFSFYEGDNVEAEFRRIEQTGWSGSSEPAAKQLAPYFNPPAEFAGEFGKYKSLLRFDDGRTVRTAEDWKTRRAEIRAYWEKLMGPWPALIERAKFEFITRTNRENFVQHRVRVEIAAGYLTHGYLLIPDGAGPFPGVVVPYYEPESSIGFGKEDLRDFGYQLARRGFVTLSIGSPGGDARQPDTAEARCQPLSFLAYVAANCANALATLPEVDSKRVGIVGHSYGGKWAMFAASLYEKFACGVWSDPGIVFDETRPNVNYWEPWYLGTDRAAQRKPGVPTNENPRTGAYKELIEAGHDLHELFALVAPRPFLVSAGSEDPPSRWQALNRVVEVNTLLGHTNRVAMTNRKEHSPNDQSNEQIYLFFEQFLRDRAGE